MRAKKFARIFCDMLLGTMPEDSAPAALLVPTAKATRATDFSIAAIMARGATPDGDSASPRDVQPDGKTNLHLVACSQLID